jgi:ribosomal protein S14
MAKEGVKAREVKRARIVAKYAEKRAALKEAGDFAGLDALPKASSPVKLHNRCKLTGRPRGYMRQFGISRVTLRDNTMYEFLDRLIAVALPRIRDFKGINDKGFDGRGNYTLGISEQIIFPEINIDKINKIQGMDITFVTSATNDVEALELLKQFGLPFKNQNNNG